MPKLNIATKPLTPLSMAACISFTATALFLILFAALPFLEPDFDPSWRFRSEYEIGKFGWPMVVFLPLMVSTASLLKEQQHQEMLSRISSSVKEVV